jgi:hypothetical protein
MRLLLDALYRRLIAGLRLRRLAIRYAKARIREGALAEPRDGK